MMQACLHGDASRAHEMVQAQPRVYREVLADVSAGAWQQLGWEVRQVRAYGVTAGRWAWRQPLPLTLIGIGGPLLVLGIGWAAASVLGY